MRDTPQITKICFQNKIKIAITKEIAKKVKIVPLR